MTPEAQTDSTGPVLRLLSSVEPRPVRWLWPGRIPLGKVTLYDGDPGLGKSLSSLDIGARVSRGREMPDGVISDVGGPAGVVLLSAEDDAADTIRPRLDAANADARRVALLSGVRELQQGADNTTRMVIRGFSLKDVDELRQAIHDTEARLVIVDPLMAYLDGDAHRDQDVRKALKPLAELAAETDAAMLVVRHFNKSGGGNPIYRGGGSIGIIGAARAGLMVARDPDDPTGERRVLAMTKCNLAAPVPSLAFHIEIACEVPRIKWLGVDQHSAESLLSAPADSDERSALSEACRWLECALADGPEQAREIKKRARDDGIAERTLERAKQRLGVTSGKSRISSKWFWELPPDKSAKTAPTDNVGGLGDLEQSPQTPQPIPPCNSWKNAKAAKAANAASPVEQGGVAPLLFDGEVDR